jgi:hypothetical protein
MHDMTSLTIEKALAGQNSRIGPTYLSSDTDHPQTLNAQAILAATTGRAGDPAGARDQLAALVPVVERVLGPDHPHTLNIRAKLAIWTGEAGDAAGARDQLAALVPVVERVLGSEYPQTLNARADLAHWTGEADSSPGPAGD